MRLLEYFERHDVTLLVCSNNINTMNSTSKIIIQVLAIIAEFERDILTERIQDNLMELAKDGRWLGGATQTGFNSKRVSAGSGKNKSAVSFLVSNTDEKALVQKIYRVFRKNRSIQATSKEINKEHKTNKTDQCKIEDDDSTFFNPKFSRFSHRSLSTNGSFQWDGMKDLSHPETGSRHSSF